MAEIIDQILLDDQTQPKKQRHVGFGEEVTKTNNRQNRIENRDFVALDPEQSRLRSELAIDGIDYQLVRSESATRTLNTFDLVEATTALACASGNVRLVVQLKREIGKLWEDVSISAIQGAVQRQPARFIPLAVRSSAAPN